MEEIHSRLRSELEAKGLSAAQAARDAGEADSQGLRDVLAGRKRLSAELLGALVRGTGIDGAYVLTGQTLQDRAAQGAKTMPQRLKALREERGLDAVLKQAGVTAKQWQAFEESPGAPQLPPGLVQRLIDGFDLDAVQFITGRVETLTTARNEETQLLKNYRACSTPDQEAIRHQAQFLASRQATPDAAQEAALKKMDIRIATDLAKPVKRSNATADTNQKKASKPPAPAKG